MDRFREKSETSWIIHRRVSTPLTTASILPAFRWTIKGSRLQSLTDCMRKQREREQKSFITYQAQAQAQAQQSVIFLTVFHVVPFLLFFYYSPARNVCKSKFYSTRVNEIDDKSQTLAVQKRKKKQEDDNTKVSKGQFDGVIQLLNDQISFSFSLSVM